MNHVQKVADGKPLGGAKVRAEDAFEPVEMDDSEGDAPKNGSASDIFG